MRIEYIGHSGALIETEHLNLIFDCIVGQPESTDPVWSHDIGKMPELDKTKTTVFFVSHNHGDHYGPQIWDARDYLDRDKVYYVLSKDVHFSSGVRQRLNITDDDMPYITRVKNYSSSDINIGIDVIHVETVPSTDCGVAYLVYADGHTIYHAGDHHLWLWEEEGEKYMKDMSEVFMKRVHHLADCLETAPFGSDGAPGQIEIACLLLDGRLPVHTYDGIDAYLDILPIKNVLPIHQWKEYFVTDEYKSARADMLRNKSVNMLRVTGENCEFEI